MTALEALLADLREQRIKHGTDFAISIKYGITRVMCDAIWKEPIQQAAEARGIRVDHWYIY